MLNLRSRNLFLPSFLLVFLTIFISSCSSSKFGQELAKNFESSSQTNKNGLEPSSKGSGELDELPISPAESSVKVQTISNLEPSKQSPKIGKEHVRSTNKSPSFKPQPYRVIIKLSGADPSAPAEEVTKALRFSGVQFHVEKIERIELKNSLKVFPVKEGTEL